MSVNLYQGMSIASQEMITLEATTEILHNCHGKVISTLAYNDNLTEEQILKLRTKLAELTSLRKSLNSTPYIDVIKIKDSIRKETDNFIESVLNES